MFSCYALPRSSQRKYAGNAAAAIFLALALPWCPKTPAAGNLDIVMAGDNLVWSIDGGDIAGKESQTWRGKVDASGMIDLGSFGRVHVAGLTMAQAQLAIETTVNKATQVLTFKSKKSAAPHHLMTGDVVLWTIETNPGRNHRAVSGEGKVGADGTINVREFGTVSVRGMTAEEAQIAIAKLVLNSGVGTDSSRPSVQPAATPSATTATSSDDGKLPWYRGGNPSSTANPIADGRTTTIANPPVTMGNRGSGRTDHAEMSPSIVRTGYTADDPLLRTETIADMAAQTPPAGRPQNLPPTTGRSNKLPEESPKPKVLPKETAAPAGEMLQSPQVMPPMAGPGGIPQEQAKVALPPYIIEPPDVLLIESTQSLRDQPIRGQHLVRPDGTVGLGIYGSVPVGGMTLEQARLAVAGQIALRVKDFDSRNLYVDVLAYNSKVYYIITDGGGYGEQVYRFPITGSETVLDAISQINGLPAVASKHVWVARPVPGNPMEHECLPVNWVAITQCGNTATNYQVLPGDRIYVKADKWITLDTRISKVISPIERMLGVTLLGSETVNSIRFPQSSGNGVR